MSEPKPSPLPPDVLSTPIGQKLWHDFEQHFEAPCGPPDTHDPPKKPDETQNRKIPGP